MWKIAGVLLVLVIAGACATPIPKGMRETKVLLDAAVLAGDDRLLPDEYASADEAYRKANDLLLRGKEGAAEEAFLLAWQKGELLAAEAAAKRQRLEDERAREIARQREAERQKAVEELTRVVEEREREEAKKKSEKARQKEKPLPSHHTVRKGETLPAIALYVYSDSGLWPLLYRANRDQIKDPKVIHSGQVLRIPRNISRDDVAEARKYALEHPF